MEPPQEQVKIRYVLETKVRQLKEEKRIVRVRRVGNDCVSDEINLGWFAHFEGSWEKLFFGESKPCFDTGDTVRITFEKVASDAIPREPSE